MSPKNKMKSHSLTRLTSNCGKQVDGIKHLDFDELAEQSYFRQWPYFSAHSNGDTSLLTTMSILPSTSMERIDREYQNVFLMRSVRCGKVNLTRSHGGGSTQNRSLDRSFVIQGFVMMYLFTTEPHPHGYWQL